MFIEERLEMILRLVTEKNRLTVKEAKEILNVSEDTIRRDFDKLAGQRKVTRTHGGIMMRGPLLQETTFEERSVQFLSEKRGIAIRAAELIEESEVLIIDAGTTTIEITRHLGRYGKLTVLTNALNIALETAKYPNITTVVFGGIVNPNTLSLSGPDTVKTCRFFYADKLFISVSAISIEKGLMNTSRHESETKKELVKIANDVIVVTDSSKIGKTALYSFGSIEDMTTLITDKHAHGGFVDELRSIGINVILAEGLE